MQSGELIPPPRLDPAPVPRARWAWAICIVVMLAMVGMSVGTYIASLSQPKSADYTSTRLQVRLALVMRDAEIMSSLPESQRSQLGGNLASLADGLSDDASQNPEAAALYLALRRVAGQEWGETGEKAIARIEKDGKNPERTILAALQGDQKAAESISPQSTNIESLIARQYGLAERPDPQKPFRLALPADTAGRAFTQIGLMLTLISIGFMAVIGALIVTLVMRPKGFPVSITDADSDRYALRMSIYFGLFIGISIAAGLAIALGERVGIGGSGMVLGLVIMGVGGLVLVPLMLRTPLLGVADPVKLIVGEKGPLWSHLLWGVGTYFLNWPLIVLLGALMTRLLPDLPPPSHEALTQLAQARDPFTLLALFFVAAVYAPIVEELMFRGVLFPAVSQATRRVWVGVLVSSLVFALIHQQGPVAWPSLALIGATAAWVTYRTGSLIPAIIMHALHNGTTLLLGYLVSR